MIGVFCFYSLISDNTYKSIDQQIDALLQSDYYDDSNIVGQSELRMQINEGKKLNHLSKEEVGILREKLSRFTARYIPTSSKYTYDEIQGFKYISEDQIEGLVPKVIIFEYNYLYDLIPQLSIAMCEQNDKYQTTLLGRYNRCNKKTNNNIHGLLI